MDGRIEQILVSPLASQLPNPVDRVRAFAGRGLDGDRYLLGSGTWSDYPVQTGTDLTLIEAEVLEAIGVPGAVARRNVVTRGVRLNDLVGHYFRIGQLECYGDRLCEPCRHLEGLGGPSVAVLTHRGGLRADILADGEIRIGDQLTASSDQGRSGG